MRSSSRCARCFRACSLDSPYCGVVGPRGDLHPWRAVYMSVLSVDDVPLYHLCPGGVALRVVVPGALYSCSSCWWRDYADPRAVVLRELSPDAVVSKARLAAADLVLIDGCEPAVHDEGVAVEVARLPGRKKEDGGRYLIWGAKSRERHPCGSVALDGGVVGQVQEKRHALHLAALLKVVLEKAGRAHVNAHGCKHNGEVLLCLVNRGLVFHQ